MATTTTTRRDDEIQQEVLAELAWDAQVQPNEIGVSVQNGIVTLTGWVDSFIKKWAAEQAAHRVRGVVAVANDLEIRLPTSEERTDADIAAAALHALETDANRISVEIDRGKVTLEGPFGPGPRRRRRNAQPGPHQVWPRSTIASSFDFLDQN
jgi:osmotically-inducible protein OsmY